MKIDVMRAIDFWVGVPLCFLFSIIFLLVRPIGRTFGRAKPAPFVDGSENVLLIELSEMGSAILVDPMMRELGARGANLHFVIFKQNAVSLSLLKTVPAENIYRLDADGLVGLSISSIRFLLWCRKRKISVVIDLELFSRFTSLLTLFSGATWRVGFSAYTSEGLYRGTKVLTHPVFYNPYLHITQNFLALARSLFTGRAEWPLLKEVIDQNSICVAQAHVTEEQCERIGSSISRIFSQKHPDAKFVLLNTIGGDFLPQRRWPKEYFIEIAKKLLEFDHTIYILFTGAASEFAQIDPMVQSLAHVRAKNFAGFVEFTDLPALYQLSTLMLTNDSGPAHFASTTKLPTYVFFGPETPRLYGALGENFYPLYLGLACSPCVSAANHRKTVCQNNLCLKQISPDMVFREIQKHLPRPNGDPESES